MPASVAIAATTATGHDDELTVITEITKLCQLRDLYLREWPKHSTGYYCLDNFIRWLQREPAIKNLHIYTVNGDWQSHGLCLIVDRYQLFVNSLAGGDDPKLAKALSLLDWSGGLKVSSMPEKYRDTILSVIEPMQLIKEYDSLTVMYYLPKEHALNIKINCPEGFTLRSLSATDADVIDEIWPNRHVGSLFFIKRLIAWNANMGVYVKETNELVAWCLRLQGGFLGALQVKDSHKRHGLGSLVASATARKIAEMGHDVMATVDSENLPSRSLFVKLGFKVTDNCYWIRTYPTRSGFVWPENE